MGKENATAEEDVTPLDEPKDWLDLPLLTRLDSLHLLTEWQFQNPHRLRQFMKDDGDAGHWVRAASSVASELLLTPSRRCVAH